MKKENRILKLINSNEVILAPMAGITSFSYRKFMKQFGCSLTYTEMISDCGLIYDNKRTFDMIKSDGSDRPLAIQLFGGKKETLLEAIEILEKSDVNYDILDLNLACPVPKVTKGNGGSSWLKDIEKMKDMVSAVVKKSSKPVSCKVRLGWESINIKEIAKALEEAGCELLIIHARTKKELYSGIPHYEELSSLHEIISIPYAISGNIFTLEDAKKAKDITKADFIAVARGGIGNPTLLTNINNYLKGSEEIVTTSIKKQKEYLLEFISLLVEEVGEVRANSILRGIAPKFFSMFPNSKELRNEIATKSTSLDKMLEIINSIKE